MATLLTNNLRFVNINNFKELIDNQSVYFSFSNPTEWSDPNTPDTPLDNVQLVTDIFSDMIYMKRVIGSNITNCVRHYRWISGARYQEYTTTEDINTLTSVKSFIPATATSSLTGGVVTSITILNGGSGYTTAPAVSFSSGAATAEAVVVDGSVVQVVITNGGSGYVSEPTVTIAAPAPSISSSAFDLRPFYVVTDDLNVYKCLENNSGAVSTTKPTSTSTADGTPAALADGYIWKYMFTISAADAEKFVSSNWIPVKTLTSDDGSLQWDVQTNNTVHGLDPVRELNATTLLLKVRVAGSEGGTIVDENDYRQIALLLNPVAINSVYAPTSATSSTFVLNASHDDSDNTALHYPNTGKNVIILSGPGVGQVREIVGYDSGTNVVSISPNWDITPTTASTYGIILNATTVNQTVILDLGVVTNGPFVADTTITQATSGATGVVLKHDTVGSKLYVTSVTGTFDGTNNVSVGSVSSTVIGVTQKDAVNNIGSILHVENRKPITRYSDQIEDIRILIQY